MVEGRAALALALQQPRRWTPDSPASGQMRVVLAHADEVTAPAERRRSFAITRPISKSAVARSKRAGRPCASRPRSWAGLDEDETEPGSPRAGLVTVPRWRAGRGAGLCSSSSGSPRVRRSMSATPSGDTEGWGSRRSGVELPDGLPTLAAAQARARCDEQLEQQLRRGEARPSASLAARRARALGVLALTGCGRWVPVPKKWPACVSSPRTRADANRGPSSGFESLDAEPLRRSLAERQFARSRKRRCHERYGCATRRETAAGWRSDGERSPQRAPRVERR